VIGDGKKPQDGRGLVTKRQIPSSKTGLRVNRAIRVGVKPNGYWDSTPMKFFESASDNNAPMQMYVFKNESLITGRVDSRNGP
jgi:hypothetical protein